ncbi:hypothetical protein GCM10028864_11590 [Microlunatus parietis]
MVDRAGRHRADPAADRRGVARIAARGLLLDLDCAWQNMIKARDLAREDPSAGDGEPRVLRALEATGRWAVCGLQRTPRRSSPPLRSPELRRGDPAYPDYVDAVNLILGRCTEAEARAVRVDNARRLYRFP